MRDHEVPLPEELGKSIRYHALRLEDLSLQVRLGCEEAERARRQEVRVTAEIRFIGAPAALFSDSLTDTICYARISEALKERFENHEYRLIEKMAADAYEIVRELSRGQGEVGIRIHKVRPPVESLMGGSSFRCGDFLL